MGSAKVLKTRAAKAPEGSRWFYNYVEGYGVNADNAIAKWPDDVFFETAG